MFGFTVIAPDSIELALKSAAATYPEAASPEYDVVIDVVVAIVLFFIC
jgi:hypothetical protein